MFNPFRLYALSDGRNTSLYCGGCLNDGNSIEENEVSEVSEFDSLDAFPICEICHEVFDYMPLTDDGKKELTKRMWSDKVKELLNMYSSYNPSTELPAFGWPCGYPIIYIAETTDEFHTETETVCADCANKVSEWGDHPEKIGNYDNSVPKYSQGTKITDYYVWEGGDPVICDECYDVIDGTEEDEPMPEEGDLTTEDHTNVYQYGKLVLETTPENFNKDVKEYMEKEVFFVNVWFISDHGNIHLIDLG